MVAKKQHSRKRQLTLCAALASAMFFCNFTTFSAASPSETKTKHRLPASVAQQHIDFDCSKPSEMLEVTTAQETIRLQAKNCPAQVLFKNDQLQHPLVIFPLDSKKLASEFAYLSKGENLFSLTVGDKIYKVSVVRY
jgi:hypothetical protein